MEKRRKKNRLRAIGHFNRYYFKNMKNKIEIPLVLLLITICLILSEICLAGCARDTNRNCIGEIASDISISPKTDKENTAVAQLTGTKKEIINNINLQNRAFMCISDRGYTSTQGMCVINNQYVVIARYLEDNAKDLMVYDALNKSIVSSNVFRITDPDTWSKGTNVDLDHANGLAYNKNFIYVPRSGYGDIVKLKINKDFSIVFDSIVYTAPESTLTPVNIACHDGIFYWTVAGNDDGQFTIYRTTDFNTVDIAFSSDFGGLVRTNALTRQGLAFDGNYLYFAFSGRLNVPANEGGTDKQKLMRNTEKIIVTETTGKILRVLEFSRGSYGEIEDVDICSIDRSEYLLIGCNQNDNGVAHVYTVPVFDNTVPSKYFETTNIDGILDEYNKTDLKFYCDNTNCFIDGKYYPLHSNPFASGLEQDPFTDVYAALSCIKRCDCPATLYLTGLYGNLLFCNLPSELNIVISNAEIDSLVFVQCPGVTVSGENNAVLRHLKAERSIVLTSPGIKMERSEEGPTYAIEANNALVIGSFSKMVGYDKAVRGLQGVVAVSIDESDFEDNSKLGIGEGSLIYVNEKRELLPENKRESFIINYVGCINENAVEKYEKNVMLNLTLGNGTPFTEASGNDYIGTLPKGYWPTDNVTASAMATASNTGEGECVPCILYISSNGKLSIRGDADRLRNMSFVFATVTFMTP